MSGTSARRRPTVLRLLAAAAALAAAACAPTYIPPDRTDRRPRELQVTSHFGGTHHRLEVEGNRWVQTFGNALLVIDTTNGRELGRVEPQPFGVGGALTDLVLDGDRATVVADQTAVVEVDISEAAAPKVTAIRTAKELGIEPRALSRVGDVLWACGEGGCVRLSDGTRFLTGQDVTSVFPTSTGEVATVGRRIVTVDGGRYVGAASWLGPLPAGVGPAGGALFVLQGSNGATVGLMNAAFSETAAVAVPAFVRHARILGQGLVVMTDRTIYAWRLADGKLVDREEIPLKGGRDVGLLRPNHFAVAGSFGRAMYRRKPEGKLPGDTFYNVQREPGLLEVAMADSRRILAGGREGSWLWKIGGEATLTDKTVELSRLPSSQVTAAWGSARIVMDKERSKATKTDWGISVQCKHDGKVTDYVPDGGPRVQIIELVDGDVWVGHDDGIDVLRRVEGEPVKDPKTGKLVPGEASIQAINRFRMEGPVLFIFPDALDGGASVVSLHGGFVRIKPVPVGPEPVFEERGTVK